jgi:hypothetical protein
VKKAGSLLGPLIRELGIEEDVKLAGILKDWQSLFGKPLADHMIPYKFSQGEMLLHVDSPIWLNELNFCKRDIIKKLKQFGVREVRFRIGKVKAEVSAKQKMENRKLTSLEMKYIEETVSGVADSGLRETVKTAMEKAVASGRTKVT